MKDPEKIISKNAIYLILLFIYTIQGIILSFFMGSLSVFLVERGALLSSVAIVHLSALPFSFKLLFAPFLDIYYFKSFGKRKSYIVPANYILAGVLLFLSYEIEDLIAKIDVKILTFFGVLSIFLLALQDIAADGMGADVFKGDESIYASLPQNIGISLGSIFSSHVLVQLNSKKFCNLYIFSQEKNEGLLSLSLFLCIVGVSLFIVNIYIHIFLKEMKVSEEIEKITLKERIYSMKIFFKDKSLLSFLGFLILLKFTFSFLDSTFKLQLIKKGFPKEDLANIFALLLIVGMLFQVSLPKFLKKTSEMNLLYFSIGFKFLENFMALILLENFTNDNYYSTFFWFFLIFICFASQIHYNISFGIMGSFYNRISQVFFEGFEATCIAFLSSFGNLSKRVTDFISLSIIEKFDFRILVVIGWIFGGVALYMIRPKILNLEKKVLKESNDKKNE